MLLCKLLDYDGSSLPSESDRGFDTPPFSYFAGPGFVSPSYETPPLYSEVHFRWDHYRAEFGTPIQPQPTRDWLLPPSLFTTGHSLGFSGPNVWSRYAAGSLDLPAAVLIDEYGTNDSYVVEPDEIGGGGRYMLLDPLPADPKHYVYKIQSASGLARKQVGTAHNGGLRWLRVDDLETVFNSAVPYATRLYDDMMSMQAPYLVVVRPDFGSQGVAFGGLSGVGTPARQGWTPTPVLALASADDGDVYVPGDSSYQHSGLTLVQVRTLEVLWHSRLDATAESLAPDCVSGKADALGPFLAFEQYSRLHGVGGATYNALLDDAFDAVGAYNPFTGIEPAPTYRNRLITAARDWIDANL